MLPPPDLEQRIEGMQRLIAAGQDTGYYPLSLLRSTGLRQDDAEYGDRYTTKPTGRQARQPLSRDPRTAASGAP